MEIAHPTPESGFLGHRLVPSHTLPAGVTEVNKTLFQYFVA